MHSYLCLCCKVDLPTRNESTLCNFIQRYMAHQGSDQIASMEANVWQKSCCYLMSYDLGLMVIPGHFTPVVVRRY